MHLKADPMKLDPNVLLIMGSTRAGRKCPEVTAWVQGIASLACPELSYEVVDLAQWPLPMDDEPGIPALGHYTQAHTLAWSEKIRLAAAVVFVTPQYNWGYPAVLKNAIDHLYGEWRDKPAAIVTYGGHGGTRCAEQPKQVAAAVGLKVAPTMPAMEVPDPVIREGAALHPAEDFRAAIPQIQSAFQELQGLISDAAAAQASTAAH